MDRDKSCAHQGAPKRVAFFGVNLYIAG
jgi:hypothetical protein